VQAYHHLRPARFDRLPKGSLPMIGLTQRQKHLLTFLDSYLSLRGYPPTLREIMEEMEGSTLRCATEYLYALERKGMIKRSASTARGIEITAAGQKILRPWVGLEYYRFDEAGELVAIRV
jgi:SOS-response transcriptional repressor LexA